MPNSRIELEKTQEQMKIENKRVKPVRHLILNYKDGLCDQHIYLIVAFLETNAKISKSSTR